MPGEWSVSDYDADQYRIAVAGVPISRGAGQSGYADGEFFSYNWDEYWKTVEGADGSLVRSASLGLRINMSLTLLSTSPSNSYLSALLNKDLNNPGGLGIGSFVVKDLQGTTFIKCTRSWILKPADITIDRGATARKWPFHGIATIFVVGNN